MIQWTAHGRFVRALGYSPDGAILVSGGDDQALFVWDAVTGDRRADIRHDFPVIEDLMFSPDGRLLALATGRPMVIVCDRDGLRDGPLAGALARDTGDPLLGNMWGPGVSSIAFSPDGQYLVSVGAVSGSVARAILWQVTAFRRGRQQHNPPTRLDSLDLRDHDTLTATYSSDGRTIALGTSRGMIVLWPYAIPWKHLRGEDRVERDRHLRRSRMVEVRAGGDDPVRRIAFSPDGTTLAAAIGSVVDLWDYRHVDEKLPVVSRRRQIRGHTDAVQSLAFSPDGRTIVTASLDGTLRIWDARETFERSCLDPGIGPLHCMALAPDGMTVAVGGESGEVTILDLDERP